MPAEPQIQFQPVAGGTFTGGPPKFCPDEANAVKLWKEYKRDFYGYLDAAGLDGEFSSEKRKVGILIYGMDSTYKMIYDNFTWDAPADKYKLDTVTQKFDEHFEPKTFVKLYMKKFDECMQKPTESFSTYLARLKDIAQYCNFGDTLDNQLCKQLSNGVKDRELRDKLWADDLTLDQIIKKAHLHEQRKQSQEVSPGASADVHSFRGRSHSRGRGRGRGNSRGHRNGASSYGQYQGNAGRGQGQGHSGNNKSCGHCGRTHQKGSCPAYGKVCKKCYKRNHFAVVCRSTEAPSGKRVYEATSDHKNDNEYELVDTFNDIHVWSVAANDKQNARVWNKNMYVENAKSNVTFKLDTGAQVSILSKDTYDRLNVKPPLYRSNTRLYGLGQNQVYPIGKVNLKCDCNGKDYDIECEVVDNRVPNLLSLAHCEQLQLIRLVGTVETDKVGERNKSDNKRNMSDAKTKMSDNKTHMSDNKTSMNKKDAQNISDGDLKSKTDMKTDLKEVNLKKVDLKKVKIKWPDNVEKCEHESTKNIIKSFPECFAGLGKVAGAVSLKVDPSFTPIAHPPRPVAAALRDKVKVKLGQLEEEGIIERVPIGTATPWCSSLHVVPKKNNDVRITIDPKDLNHALIREYHPTNTVEQVAQRLHGAKYITVLDANQGYFQIMLDEESKDYTTFNTPFGRYRYLRLPMGIKSAPELFQRVFGDIFADVDGLENIMDDFLIGENTLQEHNKVLKKTLETAKQHGVTFSLSKLQLCVKEAKYSGQIFSEEGMKMDPDRIKAIVEMPAPKSVKEVQTLLGMVTYVCKYLDHVSSKCEPLRDLIKEGNQKGFKWHFDPVHQQALEEIKQALTSDPVLQYYSLKVPIVISCDASQAGLGCVLLQNDRPVAYGSKALTQAECAYAQIEKELLAICFSLWKFHTYVYGRSDITVETDHLPLLGIMEKALHQVALRMQKMRMKLQLYDFKLIHKKGTEIPVADCLSRAYLQEEEPRNIFEVTIDEMESMHQTSNERILEIRDKTATDVTLQEVIKVICEGWPVHRSQVREVVRPYFDSRSELNVIDGIIYKGVRVVVPLEMRPTALKALHTAHQGIVKSKQLARDLMYWPGINGQIEDIVAKCAPCQENRAMQPKEPLLPMPIPTRPWEEVAMDLFDWQGHKWLICVDYYSDYFELERMDHGTHGAVLIRQNKKWFSTHGIPEKVTTDNGPPWNGEEYKEFAKEYGFVHNTISPGHSPANGKVEITVGIAKNMLEKCHKTNTDAHLALLNIRNTPRGDAGSPAQRLFSRRTQTQIPTAPALLKPQVLNDETVRNKLYVDRHITAKNYHDRNVKPLEPLEDGDTVRVRVKDTWKPAKLLPADDQLNPRSYRVQLPSGRVTRRNRRHLLQTREGDIYRREIQIPDEDVPPDRPSQRAQQPQPVPMPRNVNPQSPPRPRDPGLNPIPITPPTPKLQPAQKAPETTRSGRISKPSAKLSDFVK